MKIETPRYAAANVERVDRQIQEAIVAHSPDPTVADMIAWCESSAEGCDDEANDWRADSPSDAEDAEHEATMLRAIAARLRTLEEGR